MSDSVTRSLPFIGFGTLVVGAGLDAGGSLVGTAEVLVVVDEEVGNTSLVASICCNNKYK